MLLEIDERVSEIVIELKIKVLNLNFLKILYFQELTHSDLI